MTLGEAFWFRFNELFKERANTSLNKFLNENCIARSTIINIKNGNTKCPTLAVIYQVANAFGMSYLEFLDHPIFKRDDIEYL